MPLTFSTYPDFVHKEAQHTIGEEHNDNAGDKWSYVEFTPGTYTRGIVVRDAKSSDLLTGGEGTATAAAAVGSTILTDTGEFSNKDLRGAIGTIVEGTGIGQSFFVKKVRDANIIEIQLLKRAGAGWEVALDTTSKYKLSLPGRVYIAPTAAGNKIRGITPYDEFTVPTSEFRYGYVRKTGIDEGLIDVSGNALVAETAVVVTTGGLLLGPPATDTIASIRNTIGYSVNGDLAGDVNALALIEFTIVNNRRSLRHPRLREEPKITVE